MGCVNQAALKKRQTSKNHAVEKSSQKIQPNNIPEPVRQVSSNNLETQETKQVNEPEQKKQFEDDRNQNLGNFKKDCEQCAHYYAEHDLDNAITYTNRIKDFLPIVEKQSLTFEQKQKLQEMKKLVKIIQTEYKDMVQFDEQIKRGGWIQKSNKKGIKVSTRRQEQGTVGALIESVIDVPFEVFISVLIEIDLYKDFIPYMKVSEETKYVSRNCRLGYAQSHFPILSIRQAFFQGLGYNRLHKDSSLFLYTRSIHNREDLQNQFDHKCEVNKDNVQLEYKYFVVKYEPIDKIRGKVTLAMNVDIKISFIPLFIQDKISQDYGQQFFTNIVKISKKFKGSKWEQNVKKNPGLFDFFKNSLEKHLQGQSSK